MNGVQVQKTLSSCCGWICMLNFKLPPLIRVSACSEYYCSHSPIDRLELLSPLVVSIDDESTRTHSKAGSPIRRLCGLDLIASPAVLLRMATARAAFEAPCITPLVVFVNQQSFGPITIREQKKRHNLQHKYMRLSASGRPSGSVPNHCGSRNLSSRFGPRRRNLTFRIINRRRFRFSEQRKCLLA